ncbi:PREDICTED: bcl-2-like protein 1 isoform X2 [Propithecus coquereli]|uniref:bcl-2-like protein 1 isoform X2 n=1 Tax=Propithecus coquereli TaxID=379532 RepID=UPI00063F8156|nr:PREDICTED: bcl-2-like protein 1 isoform X2 [Propithecus coquereli]
MSQNYRQLVVDFLSYKLSQKEYSWNQLSDEEENRTVAPEGTESEMETPRAINDSPSRHLEDSPPANGATGHSSSLDAREEILMAAVKHALRETGDEFELRYRWTFSDLTSQLHITPETAYQSFEQNGGWDTFVELYGNNAAAESRKGQERFNRWFLTGMAVAGVVLLGLLFSRR